MKRKLKVVLAISLVLTMAMSQMAFAKSDNSGGRGQDNGSANGQMNGQMNGVASVKEKAAGYQKNLSNFTEIDPNRIRVNNRYMNFDTAPMIKDGRTLVPVRAVIESLGGLVFWDEEDFVASIISPDGDVMIKFYLDEDQYGGLVEVYYSEGGVTDPYDDDLWDGPYAVDLDVLPGLHNNRTYVPLRFIAEIFGLGVHYDPWTGDINILDGPMILKDTDNLGFEYDLDDVDDDGGIRIFIDENDVPFIGLYGIVNANYKSVEYTTESAVDFKLDNKLPTYATEATLVLTLDEDNFDDEGVYKFVLKFAGDLQDIFRKLVITIED